MESHELPTMDHTDHTLQLDHSTSPPPTLMRSLLARARDVRDVARTKLDGAVATVAAARRETSQQLGENMG